jgi:hypothetical protein
MGIEEVITAPRSTCFSGYEINIAQSGHRRGLQQAITGFRQALLMQPNALSGVIIVAIDL